MIEISDKMKTLLNESRNVKNDADEDMVQVRPPDTDPIVFVTLHGTRFVRGAKIITPGTIRPLTWRQKAKAAVAFPGWLVRQAWAFAKAMASGQVSSAEYVARMDVCGKCPKRYVVPVVQRIRYRLGKAHKSRTLETIREKSYCGPCQCPKWYFARLDNKNHLRGWKCPLRRHEGPYADDAVRDWILDNGYATAEQLKPDGGSCNGCGGR